MAEKDLRSIDWPPALPWSGSEVTSSLDQAYGVVAARGWGAQKWYLDNHDGKKQLSKIFRGASSIAIGSAALFPAVAVANPDLGVATWGYVPLALAAGLYGADRVFGFSDAWMRYMVTAMKLASRLEVADVQWEARRASWGGSPPPPAEVEAALVFLIDLAAELSGLVSAETEQWANQIAGAMSALQAAAEAARTR